MEALAGSGKAASSAQIAAAHQLAGALEAEEAHFLVLAGDPAFHPMQRTHFPIGKLLAAVKSHQDVYDVIAEQWSQDGTRGAPLAQVRLGGRPCAVGVPAALRGGTGGSALLLRGASTKPP